MIWKLISPPEWILTSRENGFDVISATASRSLIGNATLGLDTLTFFLLIMSGLTAAVGSIGLMGTMSMNVMERTREIGVMRAIGATDRQVMNQVLLEGMLIGLISWVLAFGLAFPISFSYVVYCQHFDLWYLRPVHIHRIWCFHLAGYRCSSVAGGEFPAGPECRPAHDPGSIGL